MRMRRLPDRAIAQFDDAAVDGGRRRSAAAVATTVISEFHARARARARVVSWRR